VAEFNDEGVKLIAIIVSWLVLFAGIVKSWTKLGSQQTAHEKEFNSVNNKIERFVEKQERVDLVQNEAIDKILDRDTTMQVSVAKLDTKVDAIQKQILANTKSNAEILGLLHEIKNQK